MADTYMHEQQANQVFDLLIEELIGDMGIVCAFTSRLTDS